MHPAHWIHDTKKLVLSIEEVFAKKLKPNLDVQLYKYIYNSQ